MTETLKKTRERAEGILKKIEVSDHPTVFDMRTILKLCTAVEEMRGAVVNHLENNDCDCGHPEDDGVCYLHRALTKTDKTLEEE